MKSININSARGFLIQTSAGCDTSVKTPIVNVNVIH